MRTEIEIGGAHRAAFEDGVVEVVYSGDVLAPHAERMLQLSTRYATGQHSVWVADLSKLGTYTAEARKVLSSGDGLGAPLQGKSHTHVFMTGASIKTKAVFALVFAAAKLLGKIEFHIDYCDSLEDARRKGKAKITALLAEGKATLPAL